MYFGDSSVVSALRQCPPAVRISFRLGFLTQSRVCAVLDQSFAARVPCVSVTIWDSWAVPPMFHRVVLKEVLTLILFEFS